VIPSTSIPLPIFPGGKTISAAEVAGKPRGIGIADQLRNAANRLAGGRQQADRPVKPELLHVGREACPPSLPKQPGQMSRTNPGYIRGQKAKGDRLSQVQFQIGAGPFKWIIGKRSRRTKFSQPVPDRIEVPAGSLLGWHRFAREDCIDDPAMGLKQNRQVGPATGERIKVKPGYRIGGRPPGFGQPGHIGEFHDGFMQLAIGYSHAAVITSLSRLLQPPEGGEQWLFVTTGRHPLSCLPGGKGVEHSTEIGQWTHTVSLSRINEAL